MASQENLRKFFQNRKRIVKGKAHDLHIPSGPINIDQKPRSLIWTSTFRITPVRGSSTNPSSLKANVSGRTRFTRLYHIGTTSVVLAQDALKAAVREARAGHDIQQYDNATSALHQLAPDDPDSLIDAVWMTDTASKNRAQTLRLESELTSYKNNLIKESIRMGNGDLARHYQQIGDLNSAYKCASRMREYCTNSSHILSMSMLLITLSIEKGDWIGTQNAVMKVRNLQLKESDALDSEPKLHAALGLAQMCSGNYLDAARSFIQTDLERLQSGHFTDILTPNDVAVYGALCALASMDRDALQSAVLDSPSFRAFLELEPHLRRAITLYCSGKYSACLAILASYRPDYLLDIHLHKRLPELYATIRQKSIVQYFIPFSCVTLDSLTAAFSPADEQTSPPTTDPTASIEAELTDLIHRRLLDARIDLHNRLLVSLPSNFRHDVHREALDAATRYERAARQKLLRMNLLAAGLEVKAPRGRGAGGMQGMQGVSAGLGARDATAAAAAAAFEAPDGRGGKSG